MSVSGFNNFNRIVKNKKDIEKTNKRIDNIVVPPTGGTEKGNIGTKEVLEKGLKNNYVPVYSQAIDKFIFKEYNENSGTIDNETKINNLVGDVLLKVGNGLTIKTDTLTNNIIIENSLVPKTIELEWENKVTEESEKVVSCKELCTQNSIGSIISSEVCIKNVHEENDLELIIKEGVVEVLHITILPNQVQKYKLSNNTKTEIFINGSFSGNYSITGYSI